MLHIEELHSVYIVYIDRVIKSRRFRFTGHVARMEEGWSTLTILTGNPKGKRPLGRNRLRWENNIRIDLKEIGKSTRNCVDSARDRNYWRTLLNATL